MIEKNNTAAKPAPPAAVLDGTYHLDHDLARQTANGAPDPQLTTGNITWWAFRSSCTSTGCVATGTRLDGNNHQVAQTPADTGVLHFTDGHWQSAPVQRQVPYQRCLGADGKSVVAGADTEMLTHSFEPQPDGTLRGVQTDTVLTNECGYQGKVWQTPLVATRVGDVPAGVAVADPATVTAAPAPSSPSPGGCGCHSGLRRRLQLRLRPGKADGQRQPNNRRRQLRDTLVGGSFLVHIRGMRRHRGWSRRQQPAGTLRFHDRLPVPRRKLADHALSAAGRAVFHWNRLRDKHHRLFVTATGRRHAARRFDGNAYHQRVRQPRHRVQDPHGCDPDR